MKPQETVMITLRTTQQHNKHMDSTHQLQLGDSHVQFY